MLAAVVLLIAALAAGNAANSPQQLSSAAMKYELPGIPPRSRRHPFTGGLCGNTAAFAVTGALEIGYQMLTGNPPTKLSEQEIVDCFYSGCADVEIDHLIKWTSVQQRLAPEDGYVSFQGGSHADTSICRAAQAPNALEVELKLNQEGDQTTIQPEEVDGWLEKSGFVFARINTDEEKCSYMKRKSKLLANWDQYTAKYFDKDEDGFIDGYSRWLTGENGHVINGESTVFTHINVLIVGTHKDEAGAEYYIVRDSRGDTWMRRGHFLIPRGGNVCGIEYNLKAAEVTLIDNKASYDPVTKCPVHSPKWCKNTYTCTKTNQECVSNEGPHVQGYDPKTTAPANKAKVWDFSGRAECQDRPGFELTCADYGKKWENCMNDKIKKICAGTCLVCARDSCADNESFSTDGDCSSYVKLCGVSAVMALCPHTCQLHPSDCGTLEHNVNLLAGIGEPPTGMCHPPTIENGRVLNRGMLQNGEVLEIECDSGYRKVGYENHCVMQDLYGPDSRIMQACVQVGGENWDGNGKNYSGQKDETLGYSGCVNWQAVVAKGLFNYVNEDLVEYGKAATKQGSNLNHNYCRNPGGVAPVPWCFSDDINLSAYGDLQVSFVGVEAPEDGVIKVGLAEIMYCDDLPRCGGEYCANAPPDDIFCIGMAASDCSMAGLQGVWSNKFCPRFCCSAASQCEETPGFGEVSEQMPPSEHLFEGEDLGGFGGDDFGDFGGDDFGDFGGDFGETEFDDFGDGFGDFEGGDFGDFGDFEFDLK